MTTAVALENNPNAMPEFCTWWIQSGPSTCVPSSRLSVLVTMCFVSWSAAIAANAMASSAAHCHDAGGERPLRDGQRCERIGGRADAHVGPARGLGHDRSASRLQSMQSDAHGYASSRAGSISSPRFVQIP